MYEMCESIRLLTSMLYILFAFLQRECKERFGKIMEVALETNLGIDGSEVIVIACLEERRDGMYVVARGERE